MRIIPDLRRLGITYLIKDHLETLYEIDVNGDKRLNWSDIFVFYGAPFIAAALGAYFRLKIHGLAEIIGGMAILTGLLFGLLVHVFSLGLRLRDDPRYTSSSNVSILIDELRANVSYSCGIALLLTAILMIAAALSKNAAQGLNFVTSAISIGLFANLALTLLMVINRVRSAYRIMAI